ncbi:SDR family oxidoreductase [Streptomyces sp. NPDC059443]|uniref:SDR family oxidoreductase n=1 Tax=unclassified Streptomyces TaxID=2593676 RepID=UPI0036B989BD
MSAPILVTGGTGTLGSQVVPLLRGAGQEVRVLTRHAREPEPGIEYVACDLLGGQGIEAALEGVEVVLHLAGGAKGDDVATRNLATAAAKAGVRHLVYISVVAADKLPIGYFKAKLGAELAVAESGVPWTTLRAAQFHEFVLTAVSTMAKLPVVPVPGGLRFQPVDSRDVAERLVELALGAPQGRVPDLVGPKVYALGDLSREHLRATGKRRPKLPVRIPGKAGRAYRAAENLTLEGALVAGRSWEDFLAEQTAEAAGATKAA